MVKMSFVKLTYKTTFNSVNQMIKLAIETDCFSKFSHVNNYRTVPKNCPFCRPHLISKAGLPWQVIGLKVAKKIANGIIPVMTDI